MIYSEEFIMPAADLGKCNPLPDLKNVSYIHAAYELSDRITKEERAQIGQGMISTLLPYKLQDGYNRTRKNRAFKAVRLENKYLRAIFLPELGGRLWSLYDKEGGRELLYKNTVFQPANLALRNAWFSGGVEFNVDIKGHNPLTSDPLFAEILTLPDGRQILRMYEYERIRGLSYSICAYLPEDSRMLYIRDCIENTTGERQFTYWWSNIAVPQTDGTRVIVPAEETFVSEYNQNRYTVDKISVPRHNGIDYSYPKNAPRSYDFFYKIPSGRAKWIAAVRDDGSGLMQISEPRMFGRKLFVWGQGAGGKNWAEWLSEPGQAYIEIQAGLANTQLEHFTIESGEKICWTEAYCAVNCDKDLVRSDDWKTAQNAVGSAFTSAQGVSTENWTPPEFPDLSAAKSERVFTGSGWGALENMVRSREGKPPVSTETDFYPESLGKEQECWLYLAKHGEFPDISPQDEPISYVSGSFWREPLIAAAKAESGRWYALMQLGVHYYMYNEIEKSCDAWEESLSACESAWVRRNLALLYRNEYQDNKKAVEYITRAVELKNDCRGIIVDCAKILTDNSLNERFLSIYDNLPKKMQNNGRVRYYKALALIRLGRIDEACGIINDKFEMCDIQEGEVSVSQIWQTLYGERLRRETGSCSEEELRRVYPLPRRLDFRMF